MGFAAEIKNRSSLITVLGTALFLWFVFESVQFIVSGQLLVLVRTVPALFRSSALSGIFIIFHIVMATLGAFVAIPLLRGGRTSGLVLGIAYRLSGNTIVPFSVPLSDALLITPANEPTVLSQGLNVLWLIVSLAVLLLYFFLQRQRQSR
jgi:hypothetical protein